MDIPETMTAVVIEGYGGPEVLHTATVSVPSLSAGDLLIAVTAAGVGVWDAMEREGKLASVLPDASKRFPRVIGGDGAGVVAGVGDGVDGFDVGDDVYGYAYTLPTGGFYAPYVIVPATQAARLPRGIDPVHAAALAIPGGTALRGLTDALAISAGQRIAVFGASGTVGLAATQLAKRLGATVLAVVSGAEGADLARRAGADSVADSRSDDLGAAVSEFAVDGLDAVLATANGDGLDILSDALRDGGVLAFPHGVQPEPTVQAGRTAKGYDGNVDHDLLVRLNDLVAQSDFIIQVSNQFPLAQAAAAHEWLADHHPGRPILNVAG